jgi:hypothetical protein
MPATELQYERVSSNSREFSNGWNVGNSTDASKGVGRQKYQRRQNIMQERQQLKYYLFSS